MPLVCDAYTADITPAVARLRAEMRSSADGSGLWNIWRIMCRDSLQVGRNPFRYAFCKRSSERRRIRVNDCEEPAFVA